MIVVGMSGTVVVVAPISLVVPIPVVVSTLVVVSISLGELAASVDSVVSLEDDSTRSVEYSIVGSEEAVVGEDSVKDVSEEGTRDEESSVSVNTSAEVISSVENDSRKSSLEKEASVKSPEESEVDRPEVGNLVLAEYVSVDESTSNVSIEEASWSVDLVGTESVVER